MSTLSRRDGETGLERSRREERDVRDLSVPRVSDSLGDGEGCPTVNIDYSGFHVKMRSIAKGVGLPEISLRRWLKDAKLMLLEWKGSFLLPESQILELVMRLERSKDKKRRAIFQKKSYTYPRDFFQREEVKQGENVSRGVGKAVEGRRKKRGRQNNPPAQSRVSKARRKIRGARILRADRRRS